MEFDIALGTGAHTITVGAWNNASTEVPEYVRAYFDDINVAIPSADYTMTVDVTAVINTVPTAADNTVVTLEDTDHTFTVADFNFSDPDGGDTLQQVQITSLETAGTLQLSGGDVVQNQIIQVADIIAGNLTFTPAQDANGAGYASFDFKVSHLDYLVRHLQSGPGRDGHGLAAVPADHVRRV